MTPSDFASRLCLRPFLTEPSSDYGRPKPDGRTIAKAAVLVPIIQREQGLTVLLTQRSMHLRHHPGQIAFPGGKHDETDFDLKATAYRESEEEIGLLAKNITPLGWLPDLHTISHFKMSPLVALITPNQLFVPNQAEVSEIFEVPLSYLLDRTHQFYLTPKLSNLPSKIHFIPFKNKLIWGATAAVLQKLIKHVE